MNFAEFVAVLSGKMDLLNKAKLDNRIMQLEKEQAIFNKERYLSLIHIYIWEHHVIGKELNSQWIMICPNHEGDPAP